MRIEIQTTIEWKPYSVNKQIIDTDWLSELWIKEEIRQSKTYSDFINQVYSEEVIASNPQAEEENKIYQSTIQKINDLSEQKSVIISKLKDTIWAKEFDKLVAEIKLSPDYKKVTLHSND